MATSYQEFQDGPPANFNRWDIPVKMGILIGVVNMILTTVDFMFILPASFMGHIVFSASIFIIAIVLYYFTGARQRKAMGGYINIRDAFSAIFVAILISTVISTIWGIVYARVVDPGSVERVKEGMLAMMDKAKVSPEKMDEAASKIDEQLGSSLKPGVLLLSFAQSLVVSGIFGFICALIVKRAPKEVMR